MFQLGRITVLDQTVFFSIENKVRAMKKISQKLSIDFTK